MALQTIEMGCSPLLTAMNLQKSARSAAPESVLGRRMSGLSLGDLSQRLRPAA